MKRAAFLALLILMMGVVPALAQDHAEVGVFGDYFRLQPVGINFGGLGARAAFNVAKHVQFEAEMNYDFNQVFVEHFSNGASTSVANSNLRMLHGLFGPKIGTSGPVRVFFTLKGGFLNLRFDPRPASFNTFTSSVDNLRDNNVSGVLYPGAGVEFFLGPIGIRLEAGDEVAFQSPTHNDLRITFGPQLRF